MFPHDAPLSKNLWQSRPRRQSFKSDLRLQVECLQEYSWVAQNFKSHPLQPWIDKKPAKAAFSLLSDGPTRWVTTQINWSRHKRIWRPSGIRAICWGRRSTQKEDGRIESFRPRRRWRRGWKNKTRQLRSINRSSTKADRQVPYRCQSLDTANRPSKQSENSKQIPVGWCQG